MNCPVWVLATELGSTVGAVMLLSTEPAVSPALLSCIYAARVQPEKQKSEAMIRKRLTFQPLASALPSLPKVFGKQQDWSSRKTD